MAQKITKGTARRAMKEIGLVPEQFKTTLYYVWKGMQHETEHGSGAGKLNVTGDDPVKTAKIALAHLEEDPDYYKAPKKRTKRMK